MDVQYYTVSSMSVLPGPASQSGPSRRGYHSRSGPTPRSGPLRAGQEWVPRSHRPRWFPPPCTSPPRP
eukprot:2982801-Rhodomonas_salina.1